MKQLIFALCAIELVPAFFDVIEYVSKSTDLPTEVVEQNHDIRSCNEQIPVGEFFFPTFLAEDWDKQGYLVLEEETTVQES